MFCTNKVEGVNGRPTAPVFEDPVPGPAPNEGGVTWEP